MAFYPFQKQKHRSAINGLNMVHFCSKIAVISMSVAYYIQQQPRAKEHIVNSLLHELWTTG